VIFHLLSDYFKSEASLNPCIFLGTKHFSVEKSKSLFSYVSLREGGPNTYHPAKVDGLSYPVDASTAIV